MQMPRATTASPYRKVMKGVLCSPKQRVNGKEEERRVRERASKRRGRGREQESEGEKRNKTVIKVMNPVPQSQGESGGGSLLFAHLSQQT